MNYMNELMLKLSRLCIFEVQNNALVIFIPGTRTFINNTNFRNMCLMPSFSAHCLELVVTALCPVMHTRQLSTYNDASSERALDGDVTTCAHVGYSRASWWRVEFLHACAVNSVTVHMKTNQCKCTKRTILDQNPWLLFAPKIDVIR